MQRLLRRRAKRHEQRQRHDFHHDRLLHSLSSVDNRGSSNRAEDAFRSLHYASYFAESDGKIKMLRRWT